MDKNVPYIAFDSDMIFCFGEMLKIASQDPNHEVDKSKISEKNYVLQNNFNFAYNLFKAIMNHEIIPVVSKTTLQETTNILQACDGETFGIAAKDNMRFIYQYCHMVKHDYIKNSYENGKIQELAEQYIAPHKEKGISRPFTPLKYQMLNGVKCPQADGYTVAENCYYGFIMITNNSQDMVYLYNHNDQYRSRAVQSINREMGKYSKTQVAMFEKELNSTISNMRSVDDTKSLIDLLEYQYTINHLSDYRQCIQSLEDLKSAYTSLSEMTSSKYFKDIVENIIIEKQNEYTPCPYSLINFMQKVAKYDKEKDMYVYDFSKIITPEFDCKRCAPFKDIVDKEVYLNYLNDNLTNNLEN